MRVRFEATSGRVGRTSQVIPGARRQLRSQERHQVDELLYGKEGVVVPHRRLVFLDDLAGSRDHFFEEERS